MLSVLGYRDVVTGLAAILGSIAAEPADLRPHRCTCVLLLCCSVVEKSSYASRRRVIRLANEAGVC
eukprot:3299535-Amphidinium_carterae.1